MPIRRTLAGTALALAALSGAQAQDPVPHLQGRYFGQPVPGTTPRPFAHEVFAGDLHSTVVFLPDGREAYWGPMSGDLMMMSMMVDGRWTAPRVVPFLPARGGGEPFLSHDGARLFFMSMQPVGQAVPSRYDEDIWYVDREAAGWTVPRPLCDEVNAMAIHWEFSFSRSGGLYFTSSDDIYRTSFENNECSVPVRLAGAVNTARLETTPFVAPDESYLIFSRIDDDVSPRADLYVSFRNERGGWSTAVPMSDLNTAGSHELWPFVTYDGEYLFFLRNTGPAADLKPYWVDSAIINRYR